METLKFYDVRLQIHASSLYCVRYSLYSLLKLRVLALFFVAAHLSKGRNTFILTERFVREPVNHPLQISQGPTENLFIYFHL